MNPERFEIVKRLLVTLEELPAGDRSAFLDRACAGDDELREDVESLMEHDLPSIMRTGGLAAKVVPMMADDRAALGRQIGPYRLVDVLGEGGMGVVYHAEQTVPIHRDVALKLVPFGMDTARVIARFESERQALALMNHPYIAQALEAGAGDDGRPYFVMELVRGEPVTDYCAREKPSMTVRLKLFLQICEAIQHAHQRGIIHRDLKPSNVLLTKQGTEVVPKIIDFGIAKAIGEAEGKMLLSTADGQIVGTPEYMSPEQAGVIDAGLDTRTDVYSLGVMLYELVSGQRPYELKKRTAIELERAMRTPPTPPSQVSRSRVPFLASGFWPNNLQRSTERDIDAVALMAMERMPDDRYASVEQLADDIRRVLEHRPIRARTQTWTYRAERFVRRHAAAVATAGLIAGLIVAGGIGILVQRNRAIDSERRAVSEAANARGANITARELLDRGAKRLSTELTSQDVVRATLMNTIGRVYRQLGLIDESERVATETLALRRRALGPEHPEIAETLDDLGQIARVRSRYEQSEQLHREAVAMRRKLLPPDDVDLTESIHNLAYTLRFRGQFAEAEQLARENVTIRSRTLGREDTRTLTSLRLLGDILNASGQAVEAERTYRDVLTARRKVLPPNHPSLSVSLDDLANVLAQRGRLVEAEPFVRESQAIAERIYRPTHQEVTLGLNNLAILLRDLGRLDEAEPLLRDALARGRQQHGNTHMNVALYLNNLGAVLEERGRLEEARQRYDASMAMRIALQGETHPLVAISLTNIGRLQFLRGRLAEAEATMRRALAIRTALKMDKHPRNGDTRIWLGRVLEARGRLADAKAEYTASLAIQRAAAPSGSPSTASALLTLGHLMMLEKDAAGAEPLLREALEYRRTNLPPGHASIGNAEVALGDALLKQSKYVETEPLLLSSLKTIPVAPTSALYDRTALLRLLVTLYEKTDRPSDAATYRAQLQGK